MSAFWSPYQIGLVFGFPNWHSVGDRTTIVEHAAAGEASGNDRAQAALFWYCRRAYSAGGTSLVAMHMQSQAVA